MTRNRLFTARSFTAVLGLTAAAALTLAGCASSDPLGNESTPPPASGTPSSTIVVGSQAYYSNEIIAEIYAQALENAGFTVERKFQIGQRDLYVPSLEDGSIQLFPEYTGNLLQFFDPDTTATTSDDVYAALQEALPEGLSVLDQSPATDQDSYNVTAEFAAENSLTSIADLAGIEGLTLGGAPELEERPYGPKGLKELYGVDVAFSATADTTVDELVAGKIQIANVYSADPRIQTNDLVTLEDPEGLFLASNVVPVVSSSIADEIADVINPVSAALTPEGLVALNVESTEEQRSSADIATDWLAANNLG
jgi:osmoprotectant transport system substrate-binding protein